MLSNINPYELPVVPIHTVKSSSPCVYLIFDRKLIVYIGKTVNLFQRLKEHKKRTGYNENFMIAWIEIEQELERKELESQFIWNYKPKFNIWKTWDEEEFKQI